MRLPAGSLQGQRKPKGTRGGLVLRQRADGSLVAAAWPTTRPGPLPLITEQQTATWDRAMMLIARADPTQVRQAAKYSDGTGFMVRDVLVAGVYGHMVSWPGWGILPNGPAGPFLHINKRGVPTYPPRPVGLPQPVNLAYDLMWSDSGGENLLTCKTVYPATVSLLRFASEPDLVPFGVKRGGRLDHHGAKFFFPTEPSETLMDGAGSTAHQGVLPPPPAQGGSTPCLYVLAEKGAAPELYWDTIPDDCPPPPIPPGTSFQGLYVAAVWHDLVTNDPPQSFVDAAHAALISALLCLHSHLGSGVVRILQIEDGTIYNGVSSPWGGGVASVDPYCGLRGERTQTSFDEPILPDPGHQSWYWRVVWSYVQP